MNLLLDTHIWLWSHREPHKLTPSVAGALLNTANELWLSPISVWELIMLVERKRVTLREYVGQFVERSKQELSLREAILTWEVATNLLTAPLAHRDPADRFLVATAKVYDFTLVTADQRLMNVSGLKVLPNL